MRQCTSIIWFLCLVTPLVCARGPVCADESPDGLLTVDRLFGAKEFDTENVPQIRWSRQSAAYFTLDKAADGTGQNLVRIDPASGTKEVVVPASAFVPTDNCEPLKVESYEFSADETQLLIYTNSQKVWRRNTRGDYWVLDVASRELRKLGGDAGPSILMFAKFSPDGSRVAYVRENNLYVQDLQSLAVTALTTDGSPTLINGTGDWVNEEELGLRDGFRWSPDGQHILFWQFDTRGVSQFHLVNNVVSNSPRITSFAYPKVGETNSATRLGVISARGGAVQWLDLPGDPREHYVPHAEWNPDSTHVLVEQFNRLQTELRVWRVDPRTGESHAVMTETDSAWLENENPVRWLDGGKRFLWLSERSGWRQVYQAGVDGEPLMPVTQGNYDVIEFTAVDEPEGWLYYGASPENPTQRYLYRTKLDGTATERVTPASQPGWHTYDISPDGQWAVHHWSTFTTPPVVELVRLNPHTVVRTLCDNAPLREKLATLDRPEIDFFRVDIGEGVTLDGWSILPPGRGPTSSLPLVLHVYGEPHGQTVRDAWPGPRGLWHWQLAQQGFVVASVDNRGTNAPRGRAWRKAVHRQIGILAAHEQAQAVRRLLERWPFVDPARVGVWGWSGGGSMSLNAIFRYPELYRTAIAVAPVPDQRLYDTIYQERYMGLPTENGEGYREGSPLTHAHRLRGSLLLIHGTGDDNVHYQGTERLIDELVAKGKHFTVLPYPNRSHSVNEGENTQRHLWSTMARFLRDCLQSPNAPALEPAYETRTMRGWRLHVSLALLAAEPQLTAQAIELLDRQLEEVARVVPAGAVVELQKVPLYFSPEYPGQTPRAEYHPAAKWLRDNGRDPAMARSVEFSNIRIFEAETQRMPNFALHELAHAYHDRVLPRAYGNTQIQAAFARARDSGRYDRVERCFGNARPNTVERSYALTSPMEYFAECTEAYFSANDFFPFTREDLKHHDPEMFELLNTLWNQP
jgi:dipeptidyl-peptidase-4